MPGIRIGAICWPQWADWPDLLAAGLRADRLGYDSLFTWDHVYSILGDGHGPIHEGWVTISAWAARTERVRIGLMVGANPFREPALVAKMATTLDHVSGGRAILGIGSGWNEQAARGQGIAFGADAAERLRWLAEALPLMRGMLDGTEPTASGPRYRAERVVNLPLPLQPRLPILIGGGGEKVTLRLVARHADLNNLEGDLEDVRRKERVLVEHCEAIGRDPAEIERTINLGTVFIRDRTADAEALAAAVFEHGRSAPWRPHCGPPERIAERLAPLVELGYRHLVASFPPPFDEESMTRYATEVRPLLERL